jgi:hypothetical protein
MNQFDNELSILLREANKLRTPSKFLRYEKGKIYNTYIEIQSLIPTGITLEKLYEMFETILPEDLVMIFSQVKGFTNDNLQTVNNFYKLLELSPIQDLGEYKLLYDEWINKNRKAFDVDMNKLKTIEKLQKELKKYKPLEYSPIKLVSSILYLNLEKKGQRDDDKDKEEKENIDPYEIFDLTIPNQTLPYIKWNITQSTENVISSKHELYKLYTGKNLEDRLDYNKIISPFSKEKANSFTFSVWKGEGENNKEIDLTKINTSKESFLKANYNLTDNLLKLKLPIDEGNDIQSRILNRITEVFPLKVTNIKESKIAAEAYIYNLEFNDLLLSHLILNHEIMNIYLFVNESSSSVVNKKNIKIYFRSASEIFKEGELSYTVAFTLTQHTAKGGEVLPLSSSSKQKTITLEKGTPYVTIKISSADSLKVAEDFLKIFVRLMSYYKENEKDAEDLYLTFIPEYQIQEKNIVEKIYSSSDTKINRLKQAAPDVFVPGYARKCLCQFQPIAIEENEIDDWTQQKITYRGEEIERQVLSFPPDNPKYYFVCPDDNYPFPGVKRNKLENKELYPGLPCCFKDNQIDSIKSKYNQIYGQQKKSIPPKEIKIPLSGKSPESHIIKTDKIAPINRYGVLPNAIEDLLNNVLKSNTKGKESKRQILRRGVPHDTNSLLHCISIAASDKKYTGSIEEKQEYIKKIRMLIGKRINSNVCKSELYDFTEQEIKESLLDNDVFLDPNLYFRALEESYRVNLWIFAPSKDERKRLLNKEPSSGVLETPRFKLFPVRTPRPDRSNICIYRTLGSESDSLQIPQCELIVWKGERDEQTLFDRDMFDLLYKAYLSVNRTITWELFMNISQKSDENIQILARDNLYSRINFLEYGNKHLEKPKEYVKQYIDDYGKLRGLYWDNLMFIFPSSSPENLHSSKEILRGKLDDAIKVFKNPIAISIVPNTDLVDGLWIPILDITYGIYVPIQPVKREGFLKNLIIGPGNPLEDKGKEVAKRYRKLQRDLDFIKQTVKWLYSLTNISFEDFLNNNAVIGEENNDSAIIYDFKNIGRKFPKVNNLEEGKKIMKERVPTLFRDVSNDTGFETRIYFYSKKFFDGLYYILSQEIKEGGLDYLQQGNIHRNLSEEDFIKYPGVSVFFSQQELDIWLNSLNKYYEIYNTIKMSDASKTDPYFYRANDGHIYLIQNVVDGSLSRSLNISYFWNKHKVNPGFKSPEIEEELGLSEDDLKYVVYTISSANTLVPTENHAGDTLDYFSILRYNQFSHAAMLRLL